MQNEGKNHDTHFSKVLRGFTKWASSSMAELCSFTSHVLADDYRVFMINRINK